MIVSMWMTHNVVSVDAGESVTTAAALMASHHIRRLPVTERRAGGTQVVGIVSSRDLFRAAPADVNPFGVMAPERLRSEVIVADMMKLHPFTTTPDAPLEEPARAMRDHKFGGVPVLDKGALVGIITESDVFRAFVSMLESPPGSVRITFSMAQGEDIFGLIARLAVPRQVQIISLNSVLHHDQPVCVVRATGGKLDTFLDDVWKSGHHVINVLRTP
jgi:acetoin utilization protein AcuB